MTVINKIYQDLRKEYKNNLDKIPMTFCEDSMEFIPTKVWEYKQKIKKVEDINYDDPLF